jgi:RHS repeat-associated protein
MPVDIASGTVRLDYEDISVPGKLDLIWDRRYSTALLDTRTPLGYGWTCRYFATLTKRAGEYEFLTPDGGRELFSDPNNTVEQGKIVQNFGAFLEIFKSKQRYIVQNWNVETGSILRYCFVAAEATLPWRLSSIEDVTGQALDLAWNNQGRLAGIQQRIEKRALLLGYTPAGYIEQVTFRAADGARQIIARYEYDSGGHQVAVYDAADNADRYEYDKSGRLVREIVRDGGIFHYRYDGQGRCVKTSGLDHYQEKRLRYLDGTYTTEVTDSYDHTHSYQYLPSGQMVREVDPIGCEKTTEYDDYGRIVAKADAMGAVTRYTYDRSGNRVAVTDGLGNTSHFTYNDHHLPLSMTDPLGHVWRRAYDGANRLVGTLDPLGNRWLVRYDADGNLVEIENPSGALKKQQYAQGTLVAATDWLGNITHFRLDGFGRVIERTSPLGETTRFRYDRLGDPIEVFLPDGSALQATYDRAGNLTSFSDGNGHTTRFRYGPCQRLLERIDPVGGVVRYVWGSEPDRLEQVINEKGETYTFFRDEAGRIVREQSFDGAQRHFRYDAEGRATAYTNAAGETIAIQYDALGRIVGQTLPDGEQASFSYDPIGNMLSAVNIDIALSFERDPLGRIVKEVQGGHWVQSRYDALDNLIHTTTSLQHQVDYEADANGLVRKITTLGNQSLEFKYNANGQETRRQMQGGVVMEQHYDEVGRLIVQKVEPGRFGSTNASIIPEQREIIRRSYAYDRNGLLTSIVDGRWGRMDYVYDPAERLLRAMRKQGPSEQFVYDATGNTIQMQKQDSNDGVDATLVYGPGNRLLQEGSTRYEYDAEGRRIKKIELADSDSPKVWLYEWNALDRLKAVTRPDGDVWRYKYDALARRIEKAGPGRQTKYLWDCNVIVHELGEQTAAWITRQGTFSPLAKVQNGSLYPIITDHLGTPREMLDVSGQVVWVSSLDTWGRNDSNQGSQTLHDCPIRFQGQWFDEECGLHYSRFRYFDPKTANFISQDPIGLVGGLNVYSYAKNPIHWIDPLGLKARIDENGFFAHSNEYGRGSGSGVVRIPYQGTRTRDFTLANRAAGFSKTPEGYTWHHANYNPRTGHGDMQLVRTGVHDSTSHSGGVSDFTKSTGIKYDTCDAVTHVEKKGRLRGQPCR